MAGPTLIRPPPQDPSKSPMENVLELLALTDIGPVGPELDMIECTADGCSPGHLHKCPVLHRTCTATIGFFTDDSISELWHPPGARGVYGGAVIAQCLAAAQQTVPPPSPANDNAVFLIHSMHCYFVLAGDASIPILYHVERVREGKSFLTRTVQARQRGKCIFSTTASFMREGSGGKTTLNHGWDMPEGVQEGLEEILKGKVDADDDKVDASGPFVSKRLDIQNCEFTYGPWEDFENRQVHSDNPSSQTNRRILICESHTPGYRAAVLSRRPEANMLT